MNRSQSRPFPPPCFPCGDGIDRSCVASAAFRGRRSTAAYVEGVGDGVAGTFLVAAEPITRGDPVVSVLLRAVGATTNLMSQPG